ncbi:hypothetical protein [Litorimonas sp. WD9-15]|uniref:hypothetical protein n=1 Tax=Litorimonas sp. WD9-15 TaxID=3418716 RepID=UPI003D03C4AB
MEFLNGLLNELMSGDRPLLSFLFFLNIILLVLSRPIIGLIAPNQDNKTKVKLAQSLNILVLGFQIIDFALRRSFVDYDGGYLVNLGISLMVIYTGIFLYSLSGTFTRRRFGKTRNLDDKTLYIETYNSRLINILLLAVIVLTVIYSLIKVWGADSLLETTGIFGIFIAFLAFTSAIWAPDIVSGLIILNSEMIVDGDVVILEGHADEFIVARVTLIYVVLYDVRNNHRTLLRNTRFIQGRIDNLSRIASSDGIRQALKYNIGYPEFSEDPELREAELAAFQKNIGDMFTRSFEACDANNAIKVNRSKPFEWAMTNAGDYALEYTLWVYLDRIPNTKITATIRSYLMGAMYKINENVYAASVIEGVDLSTPDLVNARLTGADTPQ